MGLFVCSQAFWRDDGSSGEFVTHGGLKPAGVASKYGPLTMGYDDTTENGNPALVSFLSGTQAIAWREVDVRSISVDII